MMRMENVPDLTDQLRHHGLYQEYAAYKAQCRRYQAQKDHGLSFSGAPQSQPPAGGLGILESFRETFRERPDSSPVAFEEYYPTHRKFMWHHTAAYWTAVLFVQGSLLFTLSAWLQLTHLTDTMVWTPTTLHALTLWPNLVGGMMFLVGAYCSYLNLINLKKDADEPIDYLVADWQRVVRNTEVTSRVGTLAYFIGAVIFTFATILPFFTVPKAVSYIFETVPGFVGSCCFIFGSICEMLHNGVLCCGSRRFRSSVGDPVWWISILNTIGSFNFMLGYAPGLLLIDSKGGKFFEQANFFIGSMTFIISSWLLVLMWKAHDFGLALLRQLNDAIGSGTAVARRRRQDDRHIVHIELQRTESAEAPQRQGGEQRVSIRGAFFIGVYCWLAFAGIVNVICLVLWDMHSLEKHALRDFSTASAQVLLVLGTLLVIGLHSTVTSVPKEQPYRSLVLFTRLVLTFGALSQTLSFFDFLSVPFDDNRHPTVLVTS